MSRSKKPEGLTAEELKMKMYQSLQSAGVLNNLKGYLRQNVINELRGRYRRPEEAGDDSDSDLFAATMKKTAESSWTQKAIDNLILHHLKQSRYLYSLSLFQQESGIGQYDESLTEEMLLRLGASPGLIESNKENERSFPAPHSSSTPLAHEDSKLLMWRILSKVSSLQNLATKIDETSLRETQKATKPKSLADKLQAIDEEMDGTLRERRMDEIEQRKSVATLASATRRAEEAAEKRAKDSFEQWKRVELASMRVKEQEKAKEQILAKTRELETDFAQRKDALLAREKNAIDRLNNQKGSLEKDLHHERQMLLQELEQIRVREKNLHEREQLLRDSEALKLRELDLMKSEVVGQIGSTQDHSERPGRGSVASSCAESLRKSLTGRESRQLDEVLKELDARSNEAEMLRREIMSLKEELTDTKIQFGHLSAPQPRPSPRRQGDISGRDDDPDQSIRKRLDNLTRQLNEWKSEDRARREAAVESELTRWKHEVAKLSETRDRLDEKHRELNEMTSRVSARLNGTPRSPRIDTGTRSGQLSSTSLRLLMDPPGGAVAKEASIRDYDHPTRVRWADEMPYSIRPDLVDPSKSPRRPLDVSALDLDSSNDTSASNDLSTTGLRRDIRDKFKSLEKESDDLEQMYKRYIQSNYKHISPDVGVSLPRSPRGSPRSGVNRKPKSKSSETGGLKSDSATKKLSRSTKLEPTSTVPEYRPRASLKQHKKEVAGSSPHLRADIFGKEKADPHVEYGEHHDEPLDLKSLDPSYHEPQKMTAPVILAPSSGQIKTHDDSAASSDSSSLEPPGGENVPKNQTASSDRNFKPPGKLTRVPPSGAEKGDSGNSSPVASISDDLEDFPKVKPVVSPRLTSAKGADKGDSRSLSSASSISDVLENSPKVTPEVSPRPTPAKRSGTLPPVKAQSLPPISPNKEHPLVPSVSELLIGPKESPNKSRLDELFGTSPRPSNVLESSSDASPTGIKSFERPALLQQKRNELQRSFDQSDDAKSPKHDTKLQLTPKSPNRDSDTQPKLHDEEIQNILDSIDVESARSIEGQPSMKLADMLKELEQVPSVTSQRKTNEPELVTSHFEPNEPESSNRQQIQDQDKNDENLLDERGDEDVSAQDDYSDEFASSSSSKTESEIKTMSDFEPSSTSIPRIEDKVSGQQQDDDEKSEADVNWSNLQLDKSGELLDLEPKKQESSHNKVDVFEDSQSGHSFEAASGDEKKSKSSDDDFW